MRPASLNMSHLPTLLLLVFHAGVRADPGQFVNKSACQNAIREMRQELVKPTPLPLDSTHFLDKIRLENTSWTLNLYKFLNATNNITKGEAIKKNLEFLKSCLPNTPTSTRNPIFIRKGDWNDFRKKLQYYLSILYEKVEATAGSAPAHPGYEKE